MTTKSKQGSISDAARQLGRLGASKGGHARAASLSKRRKSEIGRIAAAARWGRKFSA